MMPINTVMLSIGILAVSFLGGILFFYVMDTGTKQAKKYQLDQFLNVLIQFILYIWVMKVVVQLPRFFDDPLSVLAHPANSWHFLIASIVLMAHLWIKYRKSKPAAATLFQTSSFIFLASLFIYDILQIAVKPATDVNVMTILLAVLVVVYVLFYSKFNPKLLGSLTVGIFLLVACGISIYKGYYILFDFMLSPYFYLLMIILLAFYTYTMYKNKLLESPS